MKAGDLAWVLGSAALVMFMTPGLALFYGGMLRAKSALTTIVTAWVSTVYLRLTHWVFDPNGWMVSRLHLPDFVGGTRGRGELRPGT